jgi:tryptophan synthase alpha chain
MTGTTGGSAGAMDTQLTADASDYLERVKAASPVPVCAGFGIRSAGQVKAFAPYVDGVIVGSALVEAQERGESAGSLLDRLRGSHA